MAFEETVSIGDREITIRELTVGEVRNMAKSASAKDSADPLANWLIEDVPLLVLATMSSVSIDEFDTWRPSEIKELAERCREVNPDFFSMDQRIRNALELLQSQSSTVPLPP